jgi:DNA-directed RNA polymerase sigma subunit (sigma70/sigma32)
VSAFKHLCAQIEQHSRIASELPDHSNQDGASYREIARELGISHGRVRQIEKEAMDKIRLGLLARGIRRRDIFPEDMIQ